MDEPGWSEYTPDGEWVWREDRIRDRLQCADAEALFVSGCAINQKKFYSQFDEIVLFSASANVLIERLKTRTNNTFGKHPDELAAVLDNLKTVEPLLRKDADHEINTAAPLEAVVTAVLQLLDP